MYEGGVSREKRLESALGLSQDQGCQRIRRYFNSEMKKDHKRKKREKKSERLT
jgi:hypothetical protein